jgi:hypothetical protein
MNRKECLEKLKTGDKEFHHLYWTNYWEAREFFKPLMNDMKKERPDIKIVLHHIELFDNQYEMWDTIVPMYFDEHLQLHSHTPTEEHKKRISEANIGKEPWNKGLKDIYSEKTIKQMSISASNKIVSNEARKNYSKAQIGNKNASGKRTQEQCKRISESLIGKTGMNKGKTWKIKDTSNMSKAMKLRWQRYKERKSA